MVRSNETVGGEFSFSGYINKAETLTQIFGLS